jgi:hypothetical protein
VASAGFRTFEAHTRDLSARGVYIYLDQPVMEKGKVEFVVTLPPEVTLTDSIRVRCTGQVVRVDRDGAGKQSGFAAQITQYEFLVES